MSRPAGGWRSVAGGVATALGICLAPTVQAAEPVDIELVLAVDVSLSMSPDELETQRQGYAAALVHEPRLLIADEPTVGLDPKSIRELKTLLRQLADGGTTVFLRDVLAKAGSTEPEKLREAALKVDIPPGATPLGWGVQFAKPGEPMAGTNVRAFPVAQQWQNGALVVVAPEQVKTGEATLVPLPSWDKR